MVHVHASVHACVGAHVCACACPCVHKGMFCMYRALFCREAPLSRLVQEIKKKLKKLSPLLDTCMHAIMGVLCDRKVSLWI